MKKIFTIIAAAVSLLAVSCQKENLSVVEEGNNPVEGKLTATIVKSSTKVTYSETPYSENPELKQLQPAWEVGDEIIGFDDAGETYTFTVESVSAETATLSADNEIADGAYHLIYKSGAQASDISSKSLAIDYKGQAGDKTMPAVMLADGTVTDGSCNFSFTNAGAIIGISALNGVPSGATISKITVAGENLSAATIALDGSTLKLAATPKTGDAISTATLSGITTTDEGGTLSSPIFIAVPAGAVIAKVSTNPIQARVPETMTIPSTAADRKDIDYVEIEAKYDGTNLSTKKWAKWNIGANSQNDYGWYFAWGGTEGYVWKNDQWVSASGVDTYSYTLSSANTAGAGDYLYVKTQSFTPDHRFNWVNSPYQTQNIKSDFYSSTKWTKYLGSTSSLYKDPSATDADALKTVLDPEDDAAHANWGGSWRMPTFAELKALCNATSWTWDSTDKGYYVTKKGEALLVDKSNALLFFPAAGYVDPFFRPSDTRINVGSLGYYWSSTLISSNPYSAYYLCFTYAGVGSPNNSYRCVGLSVRPLSD